MAQLAVVKIVLLGLFIFAGCVPAFANEENKLGVTNAFIDLRTGAGVGFPVFHSVNRGGSVTLLKQKANWYKVQAKRGITGWVQADKLAQGTQHLQSRQPFSRVNSLRQNSRNIALETAFGIIGDDPMYGIAMQWRPWRCCGVEARMNKVMGSYTDARLLTAGLYAEKMLWTKWHFLLALSMGEMSGTPRQTLVNQSVITNSLRTLGLGAKYRVAQRLNVLLGWRLHQTDIQTGDSQLNELYTGVQVYF